MTTVPSPIRLAEKFAKIDEHWRPKVVAEMNDYQFKVVKIAGEFVWHRHEDTDEVFLVVDGRLSIAFRDGQVDLGPGEMVVVPRGVEHRPFAADECQVLLIEPRGVTNTGDATPDAAGMLRAPDDAWI
jgi:mannose-6-phosphate isomerase-like protein (cupin superfamily)